MATKAKPKKKTAKKAVGKIKLPVTFGGVSFNKKTARIGITVSRDDLALGAADDNFCDRRLTVVINASANGDQRDQARLPGMDEDLELSGSADAKAFGVHAETITFGLTFNLKALADESTNNDVALNQFAGREGYLKINGSTEIPEEEKEDEPEPSEPAEEEAAKE